jgi:adenylate cyclase
MNPGLPEEQSFTLPDEGAITIGRTKDNDLYCLHKSLSRKHAKVECDGTKLLVQDLQSKNGIFFNGKRVAKCEVADGESFRCGDITFLVEGSTARHKTSSLGAGAPSAIAQTLPSPFALEGSASKRPTKVPAPQVIVEDDTRYKDKLFLMIRATELLVGELSVEKVLDEIVVLAVQVLEVDRISLLTLDEQTGDMKPRVLKTFVAASARPYSKRVVDWVVDHGSPASFADVARDNTLPGNAADDRHVRAAMCVPINPGGGTIGVLYADSLSQSDCFRPDDLALMRALANLAAVTIEGAALRADRRPVASRR